MVTRIRRSLFAEGDVFRSHCTGTEAPNVLFCERYSSASRATSISTTLTSAATATNQFWQIIHGESFTVSAGPNDSVRWLQQEASSLFSKRHNFDTHVVQVWGGREPWDTAVFHTR